MDGFNGAARDEGVSDPRERLSAEPDHLPARLWWLLAALTLAWGFNWAAMKLALADVPPWIFRSLCLGLGSGVLFLVPGYGAQGGSAADTAAAFDGDGFGALVNNSRGLTFAYKRPAFARFGDEPGQ